MHEYISHLCSINFIYQEEQILLLLLFPSPSPQFGGHLFQRCWRSKGSEDCSIPCQYIYILYCFFSSCHCIWLRANLARADLSKQACKWADCTGLLLPALLLKPVFHPLPWSVVWNSVCMCMRSSLRKISYTMHKSDMYAWGSEGKLWGFLQGVQLVIWNKTSCLLMSSKVLLANTGKIARPVWKLSAVKN